MAAAKLLALFHASLILSSLLSGCLGGTCGAYTCSMDIPYPCIEVKPDSCINICGSAVGGTCLIRTWCEKRGGSRGQISFHCNCVFQCFQRGINARAQSPRGNLHFLK
ncbi:hypothetical protein Salat_2555400 [Sesamum alatum]|uniref:Uncharacterized protein n=1 Tax=Sesamum alatum TaxID=300844 RepID=A0AAE1XTJ8_9LAMI|nr:hypothetical protein Salat_2555400 [Sesamum alatum]